MSKLNDRVIERIKADVFAEDYTAIDELLKFVPKENLIYYLPEEEWAEFQKE